MDSIFLSRESGYFVGSPEHPLEDAVGLTEIEDHQRWEALYGVGKVPERGEWRRRGVVYVFERLVVEGETVASRYHYGLAYDLRTRDGVVHPESDIWMGFLYRTRKTGVNKIPYNEWFSIEPIPPIPDGLQVTDPDLLGITAREESGES